MEEEVVVERHARVVEETRVHRVARELDRQRLRVCAFRRLARRQLVQLPHHHALILRPGERVPLRTEEAGDTVFFERCIGWEFSDSIPSALLGKCGTDKGGSRLC